MKRPVPVVVQGGCLLKYFEIELLLEELEVVETYRNPHPLRERATVNTFL